MRRGIEQLREVEDEGDCAILQQNAARDFSVRRRRGTQVLNDRVCFP